MHGISYYLNVHTISNDSPPSKINNHILSVLIFIKANNYNGLIIKIKAYGSKAL